MQPLLISRFLINLRGADESLVEHEIDTREPSQTATVNFRIPTVQSVIGNIGEPLYDGIAEPLDDSTISEDSNDAPNEVQDA